MTFLHKLFAVAMSYELASLGVNRFNLYGGLLPARRELLIIR